MVQVTKHDNLYIHIKSEDRDYYNDLREFFSYHVPGYAFMPVFQKGRWNGKVCLFDFAQKLLPSGLMFDFIKFHKKKFPTEPLQVAPDVKAMFESSPCPVKYNLKYKPRDYQEDCITTALKHKRGIFHVATASGKSLIIAYIIKTLLEHNKKKQYLIIVPTINLVEQFYDHMTEYGIRPDLIGRVYSDIKEPDKPIVISTWQSLQKHHEWLPRFHGVVVDECVTGDTLISTPQGKVRIEDLSTNDLIYSYNEETKRIEVDYIEHVYENMELSENENLFEIEFENGSKLKITGNHKVLTDNGWKRIKNVAVGENIFSIS